MVLVILSYCTWGTAARAHPCRREWQECVAVSGTTARPQQHGGRPAVGQRAEQGRPTRARTALSRSLLCFTRRLRAAAFSLSEEELLRVRRDLHGCCAQMDRSLALPRIRARVLLQRLQAAWREAECLKLDQALAAPEPQVGWTARRPSCFLRGWGREEKGQGVGVGWEGEGTALTGEGQAAVPALSSVGVCCAVPCGRVLLGYVRVCSVVCVTLLHCIVSCHLAGHCGVPRCATSRPCVGSVVVCPRSHPMRQVPILQACKPRLRDCRIGHTRSLVE